MQVVKRCLIPLLCLAVILMLGSRLYLMEALPLYDTTEARYGEIARLMVDTQEWLIPQFNYNEPFLGKPPLHTWVSALSIRFFGLSEWALRLPHFIAALCVLIVMASYVKDIAGPRAALISIGVLSATPVFWVSSAMVMTDMLLLLGLTISMTNSWSLLSKPEGQSYITSINIGIGILIGMLAKGPIVVVFWGIAIGLFFFIKRYKLTTFKVTPWAIALGIGSVLSAPWFLAVEMFHPGFLNYFFIGEHVSRFIDSGWEGDRYGTAHDEPLGTIWLFLLQGLFIWLPIALFCVFRAYKRSSSLSEQNAFLISWMLASPLLFTLAGNILPAYVLPCAVPVAVLVAINMNTLVQKKYVAVIVTFCTGLLVAVTANHQQLLTKKTDKFLLEHVKHDYMVVYDSKVTFSGRFYSYGRAIQVSDSSELDKWLLPNERYYWVSSTLPTHDGCEKVHSVASKTLFECIKGEQK